MGWSAPALTGSRLAKRRWQAVAIVVAALLLAVAGSGLAGAFGSGSPDALRIFFAAMGISAALSVPGLAVVAYLDRREPESPWLYMFALGCGMLAAAGLAFVLNAAFGAAVFGDLAAGDVPVPRAEAGASLPLVAILVGPPVEELSTGIALLGLAFVLRGHVLTMRDGIVFGLLVGMGFMLIEAPFAVMQGYLDTGEAPWVQQLVGRYAFVVLSGHALYTAILGAGIGLAVQARRLRIRPILLGLLGAITAHVGTSALAGPAVAILLGAIGAMDTAADPVAAFAAVPPAILWVAIAVTTLVIQAWAVLVVAVLLLRGARFERQVIREELAAELGRAIFPGEHADLEHEPLFGLRPVRGHHPRFGRAVVRVQNKLAIAKHVVRSSGGDPEADPLVAAWREELQQARWSRPRGAGPASEG